MATAAADRVASRPASPSCSARACALAFAPVTAKLAYQDDVKVATLLTLRFVLAATLFWIVVAILRRPLPSRRGVARGLVYGLVFYAVQALLLFSAVNRIDPARRDPAVLRVPGAARAALGLARPRPLLVAARGGDPCCADSASPWC